MILCCSLPERTFVRAGTAEPVRPSGHPGGLCARLNTVPMIAEITKNFKDCPQEAVLSLCFYDTMNLKQYFKTNQNGGKNYGRSQSR